jgi:glycosyltransferase involved in cell wall biosynthesis
MSADQPHLSVVIPVYRSEPLLARTVNEIIETLEGSSFEIVLVDDGSPDKSWGVVKALARADSRVRGLRLFKNQGQHHAVLAGMSVARGDWVVTIDDDGQNPPTEIKTLMDDANGHDVVFGRFREKQAAGMRRFGTRAVRWLNIKIFGMREDFYVSNFRLIRRDVVDRIVADRTAFPYVTGQALVHSANPSWVFVDHRARLDGKSNYTTARIAALLLNILFAYSVWPLRAVAVVGFAVSVFSLLAGLVYLVMALAGQFQVQGWATVVVLISTLGGVTIGMLAMLGEYVIRILTQSRGVAPFTISERTGFDG